MYPNSQTELYDLAIVGAGAAGLTAAIYALRARKTVLIFEQNAIGGQILPAEQISNYPGLPDTSGRDFSEHLKNQVKSLGGVFALEQVEKITKTAFNAQVSTASDPHDSPLAPETPPLFSVVTDESAYLARTIILANGSAERKLNLPKERELTGRGISYCATCDGALYAGKTVAVYGGGSTAVSAALYLSGLAERVYLIHRSSRFRAEQKLIDLAETTPNLTIFHNSELVRLTSSDGLLSGIVVKNTRNNTGKNAKNNPKKSPKENASTHTDEETTLPLAALFVNIGRIPNNHAFSNLVDLDSDGYILSGETCLTRTPGVFCAGDTRKKPLNQLVTATSDGAIAATAALSFLRETAP